MTRFTYHLAPEAVWAASDSTRPYEAASLASEGFIHCTDGAAELLATANRHCVDDPRPFVALTIDLDATGARWSVEDARGIYPHVFGPIDRRAITGERRLVRDTDGRFIGLDDGPPANGRVVAVSQSPTHTFSKPVQPSILLIAGSGVLGDAHAGATVKHRSRVARDPDEPNRRQVHLIHRELHDELRASGFDVGPGAMGENVTTSGIDLLGLPEGAILRLGSEAAVEVTGLRTPCRQLDGLQDGLMAACLDRATDGALVRKSGVMAVVVQGGEVRAGDRIDVDLPAAPHKPLAPV
jgi:uncharacterized protein (DUF952 family)